MAESCSSFPTLTRTQQISSQSLVTTFSTIISTIPASTISITTTIPCGNTTCPSTVIPSEIPAHPVTTQVPVTLTSQINSVVVSTLFGSSCVLPSSRSNQPTPISTPSTVTPSSKPPSSPSPSPSPPPSSSASTLSVPRSSAIPTTILSISTRPDGIVTSKFLTLTVPPPEQTSDGAANSSATSHSNLGAIVGGSIGGAILLVIAALTAWYLLKKHKASKDLDDFDIFEKDEPPLTPKSHYHFRANHNSTGAQDPFSQQQTPREQYQPQARYDGNLDSQAQYHPNSDQMQGYQPDSQHFQHHYNPQQGQQAQQYTSPNQPQGPDPSSSAQQQYGDPQMSQQQQFSPQGWQAQGANYGGSNAIGANAPFQGVHPSATDPFVAVPVVGGMQRDSGYPENPGASSHHYHPSTTQYPPFQASNAYNSGPVTQFAPAAVPQQSVYPGSYMPPGRNFRPEHAPEPSGAYDRYSNNPSGQGGVAY